MASTFITKRSSNVGANLTAVGGYTVASGTGAVVIGLSLSNTTLSSTKANITINNGTTDFYLIKNAPISSGGALSLVGGDQKLVLQANDSIKVNSSSSVDVIMTLMETSSTGLTDDNPGGGGGGLEGDLLTLSGSADLLTESGTEDLNA